MKNKKKRVNTSIERLMEVFGISSDEVTHYLNTDTGKISIYSNLSGAFDEDGNEIKEKNPFDNKKYIEIPGILSYESFRDRERFTETVEDEYIKRKLSVALNGKNSISRFNSYLSDFTETQKKWYKFRDNCVKQRILEWVEENNLELKELNKKG